MPLQEFDSVRAGVREKDFVDEIDRCSGPLDIQQNHSYGLVGGGDHERIAGWVGKYEGPMHTGW